MRCVASHIYCFLFPVIMLPCTVLVLDILCSSYLSSGTPAISTVTPASGGTCVELSATRRKVPHHIYPWWGPPLESVGATSRILTSVWCWVTRMSPVFLLLILLLTRLNILVIHGMPVIRTVMLASGTWCVELSATRNKVPHYRNGGGHL